MNRQAKYRFISRLSTASRRDAVVAAASAAAAAPRPVESLETPRVQVIVELVKQAHPCHACKLRMLVDHPRVRIQYDNVIVQPETGKRGSRSLRMHAECFNHNPIDYVQEGPDAWSQTQPVPFFPLRSLDQVHGLTEHRHLAEWFEQAVAATQASRDPSVLSHLHLKQPPIVDNSDSDDEHQQPGADLDELKNDLDSEADERKSESEEKGEQEEEEENDEEAAANDEEEAEQDSGWTPLPKVARSLRVGKNTLRSWAKKEYVKSMRATRGSKAHLLLDIDDVRLFIANRTLPVMPRRPHAANQQLRVALYAWSPREVMDSYREDDDDDHDNRANRMDVADESAVDDGKTHARAICADKRVNDELVRQLAQLRQRFPHPIREIAEATPVRHVARRGLEQILELVLRRRVDIIAMCRRDCIPGNGYPWVKWICSRHHVSLIVPNAVAAE
jgi:hypothetical protein